MNPFLRILIIVTAAGLTALAQTFTDASHLLKPGGPAGTRTGQRGASAADFNHDGRVDIYHSNFRDPGRLYLNLGAAGFQDIRGEIDLEEGTNMWGAAFGDYDNDGYLDILFQDLSAPSKLYRNTRVGDFEEVTAAANVAIHSLAQGAAWGDFNLDGRLDFFIVNDVGPNQLFKNLDFFTFADISQSAGVETIGNSYGTAWCDIDLDGDPDAYIATCHRTNPQFSINHLLRNNGDETFSNIAHAAGVADSLAGWAVLFFDYDQDLDFDLYVTNSSHPPRTGRNRLYRNQGGDPIAFSNAALAAGVAGDFSENSYGASVADFDNDGWEDIYVTNLERADRLYRNNGNSGSGVTFSDVTAAAGIGANEHRATAVADFNDDGWIDIFTAGAPDNRLLLNNGGSNHWLRVRCEGVASNRFGVGTRIEAYADTLRMWREIRAGDSFCSQNLDLAAHFGLGQFTVVDSLVLRWPSGQVDKFFNRSEIDREIVVQEGGRLNRRPRTFVLHTPAPGDSLKNLSAAIFAWSPASDPDGDPLSYRLHLRGRDLQSGATHDTTVNALSDTLLAGGEIRLRNRYRYRWSVDVSDGISMIAAAAAGTFTTADTTLTGVHPAGGAALPAAYALLQNYPNPFNPLTHLRFRIPEAGFVELKIFDTSGRLVRRLLSENRTAGTHTLEWDGRNDAGEAVSSGVYWYQLRVSARVQRGRAFSQVQKMLLIR